MGIKVETFWGTKEYSEELLRIPDKSYWDLIEEGYEEEVSQLMKVKMAIIDNLKIIPPESRDKFIKKLKAIGLL